MIYKYQKVTNEFTTHIVTGEDVVELATIDGWTYVSSPDALPPQSAEIEQTLEAVDPDDALKAEIAAASPIIQHVRRKAAQQIQAVLPITDELKLIRDEIAAIQQAISVEPSKAYAAADARVKAVRGWCNQEKSRLGVMRMTAKELEEKP
jgi:hypothetical protein